MNKTYYFLAGLPRSGNTLLSAILNQNPDIYSTPLSPVNHFMWDTNNTLRQIEHTTRNEENKIRSKIFLSSFMDNFYKNVKEPVIIDREKMWGTPANLDLIKEYITPTPKIIFTVRDILEIIASFVKMDADYLKHKAFNSNAYSLNYRLPKDIISEFVMSAGEDIDKSLLSLASAFYPENKGIFHIVEYNDLVLKPEETMSKIYKFLDLPEHKHNFNKIEKVEVDNDSIIGLPKDLHDIRKSISQSTTSTDILSDYIKQKYSNMEFWRKDSLIKVKGKDFL
jgi:sulfotransferase